MLISDIVEIKGRSPKGRQIHVVPPETLVQEAIHIMAQHEVGSVVVGRGERLLGLVTIRELMRALDKHGGVALALPVGEIMNSRPITGSPGDTIDQVRKVMTDKHISHLPVMEGARLLDIISLQDVAKAAYSECSFENRLLKHYISHWPEPADRAAH